MPSIHHHPSYKPSACSHVACNRPGPMRSASCRNTRTQTWQLWPNSEIFRCVPILFTLVPRQPCFTQHGAFAVLCCTVAIFQQFGHLTRLTSIQFALLLPMRPHTQPLLHEWSYPWHPLLPHTHAAYGFITSFLDYKTLFLGITTFPRGIV